MVLTFWRESGRWSADESDCFISRTDIFPTVCPRQTGLRRFYDTETKIHKYLKGHSGQDSGHVGKKMFKMN